MSEKRSSASKPKNRAKRANTKTKTGKATAAQKRAACRTVRAGVYLFLAFIGVLSMFSVSGFLIDWYRYLFGSFLGFGYYILPLTLVLAAMVLIPHRRGKVRLREAALFLLPVLFGAMGHIVRDKTVYPAGIEGFRLLSWTGREMTSGGLIAGSLGRVLASALSPVGGAILCLGMLAVCLFTAANINPKTLLERLTPAPEEEEPTPAALPARRSARTREVSGVLVEYPPEEKKPVKPEKPVKPAAKNVPDTPDHPFRGVFVDFFRKDRPETPVKQEDKPKKTRKDPTAPVTPTFSVEEAPPFDPADPFEPEVYDIDKITEEFRSTEPLPDDGTDPIAPWEDLYAAKDDGKDPAMRVALGKVDFDIFTEDNPPPAELSLDEKREAAGEAHEKAAEAHDVSGIIESAASKPDTGKYIYPPLSLLAPGDPGMGADHESIVRCAERLVDTLRSFNVESTIVNVTKGPTVTRYELQLQRGIKFARVTSLSDDIALALGAAAVRIAPIPSNNSVGIEVPNDVQEVVSLRDVLQNKAFSSAKSKLAFAVGKDIAGQCVVGDIAKMPHMLIAGTTGSGKSVCINSLIVSLIYKSSPQEVRLIMVDPKMIELGMYNGVPHLLIPVVTDPKKAAGALNWAVGEMMRRYKLLRDLNVRSLEAYNEEIKRRGEGETLPQIVIIIDELADLMFVAAREVEESVARIAQMARAAGMHLVIATQRPSADVITGLMKANIPSRIAFAVASQIESRIILDQNGAEKLIGRGDMLYNPLGAGKPVRVQGCFISSKEVESVIDFVKTTGSPEYSQEILDHIERAAEAKNGDSSGGRDDDGEEADDPMLLDAISVVVERGEASTSLLQRRLKLGYARAARLIDIMEERGIVGPFEGSKPRSVTITKDQWAEMRLRMTE